MSSVKPRPLYFMTHSSKGAGGWPFYDCMRHPETEVRVFAGSVSLKYTRRVWLYVIGWPKLFLSALQLSGDCIRELKPNTVVTAHDHMLLLAFKMRRLVSRRARSTSHDLVLHGFIYTPRRCKVLNLLRMVYFKLLFRGISLIVCYSKHEITEIESLVDKSKTHVSAVQYGIGEGEVIKRWLQAQEGLIEALDMKKPVKILSAGRSARDYETLVAAMDKLGLSYECIIICDNLEVAPSSLERDNVKVLRNTYGNDYISELLKADIVIIPTTDADISSGQMVLLHALAAAKPVVITKTRTSVEYVTNSSTSRLVRASEPNDLVAAVQQLSASPVEGRTRMNIRELFETKFSDWAHGKSVYSVFSKHFNF